VHDVTVAEWVVLRALFDSGAIMPSTLAERLGMTRGAISKLVDRLTEKTLVARVAGGNDLRTQTLSLTAAGRKLVPVLSSVADANDDEFFGHLDAVTRTTIDATMKDIARRHGMRTVPVN
jgi:DNA-binding MarR family transcriptional regulator